MISLRLIPRAGGGATLHLEGLGSWAAFEMEADQVEALRQACVAALKQPDTPQSLAEFIQALG